VQPALIPVERIYIFNIIIILYLKTISFWNRFHRNRGDAKIQQANIENDDILL